MKSLLPSNNDELAAVRRRALAGDGHSCLAIALCFMKGVVVNRNYAFARVWLLKARAVGVAVNKYIDDCNEQQRIAQAKADKWRDAREKSLQMLERDNRERAGLTQLTQDAADWLKNKAAIDRAKDGTGSAKQDRRPNGGGGYHKAKRGQRGKGKGNARDRRGRAAQ